MQIGDGLPPAAPKPQATVEIPSQTNAQPPAASAEPPLRLVRQPHEGLPPTVTGRARPAATTQLDAHGLAPHVDPALRAAFPKTLDEIPPAARVNPADNPGVYLLDGKVKEFTGTQRPVYSKVAFDTPAGPKPVLLGYEPQLGAAEAKAALAAAEREYDGGLGAWPTSSLETRIAAAEKFANVLASQSEQIAKLLMWEIGKPYEAAKAEVERTVSYIRDTVVEARKLDAEQATVQTAKNGQTTHHAHFGRQPIGVALCVAPFNYPINEFLTTVLPALIMGNVVVAKTPRFGVLANQALTHAFAQAFPPGVVSLLPGDGREVISPIIKSRRTAGDGRPAHGSVDTFVFIGSEAGGNGILAQHPTPATVHKILGLGAKNAAVVYPGADLEKVADKLVKGSLGFNGQRCTAEKIIWVPRAQAEALAELIAARVDALKLGMPWDKGVGITPLPEDGKVEAMRALIDDAVARGAKVVNKKGGTAYHSLMRPAVVLGVDTTMRLAHEEQFGPIVAIAPYDDPKEVIEWQKHLAYGQQVGLWGPGEVVKAEAGKFSALGLARVNLNDVCQRGPDSFAFTGTKSSGFATLSLRDALIELSRPVVVQSPDPALV